MGLLDSLPQPELMAIGDSIYNGVRSLSINNELSQLSAPSLVAEGLGIRGRFVCPDYGRPMLIDFEKYVHMLPDVDGIKADILDNFRYWMPAPAPAPGSGLPAEVEIYFNGLILPSTVSNLMPVDYYATNDRPPTTGHRPAGTTRSTRTHSVPAATEPSTRPRWLFSTRTSPRC